MVSNAVMLLDQCRFGSRRIRTEYPIVTKHICWSLNWNSKHAQLVSIISIAFFIAVNSDPEVDASTEFCLLLNQMVGAPLQNNKMPV
jgi:hypothetical protein